MKKISILCCSVLCVGIVQAGLEDVINRPSKDVKQYYQAIDQDKQKSYPVTHVQGYKTYLGHAIILVNLHKKSLGDPQKVARFLWDTYATQDNAAKAIFTLRKPLKEAQEECMEEGYTQEYGKEMKEEIDFYNNLFAYIAQKDTAPHDQLMAVAMAYGNIPLITGIAKRSPKHAYQMHQLFEAIHMHQINQSPTTL